MSIVEVFLLIYVINFFQSINCSIQMFIFNCSNESVISKHRSFGSGYTLVSQI